MSEQKPTVALVHGAFAESASWNPVVERLRSDDRCDVVAIANPLRSLPGDATYVRDVLRSIDGPVVLVGHSYGGMVITEAALSTGLPTESPAWKQIPSWFVFGEQDQNIPAELSRFVAERAGSRGTRELPGASHAISVSQPEAVAECIRTAVAATALDPVS